MPLSEQEQRLLEEMERSLYQSDADFVATVNAHRGRLNYRRITIGALVAIVGIGLIITGVVIKQPIVGMLGFVVVLGGVLLALSNSRTATPADAEPMPPSSGARGASQRTGFMDKMNERWDRRQDEQGR